MKALFILLLFFSQAVNAQKNKKKINDIPEPPRVKENIIAPEELWNSSLQGSKWYFDITNFNKDYLILNKDIYKTNILTFIDDERFQLRINSKDCKTVIKGSYKIFKEENIFGTYSFDIISPYQNCTKEIRNLLSNIVQVIYDAQRKIIEIRRGEHPPTLPGH